MCLSVQWMLEEVHYQISDDKMPTMQDGYAYRCIYNDRYGEQLMQLFV